MREATGLHQETGEADIGSLFDKMRRPVIDQHDPRARFIFIDALRGLAAVAVVLFHLERQSRMTETFRLVLPKFILAICQNGLYGVQVFFILSGFVIAHSLRGNPLTAGSIGRFILRRHVRLDLPYWAALLGVLAYVGFQRAYGNAETQPMPSGAEVMLNAAYLQRIFHAREILAVGWTLCLEIQFYLFFVLLLALGRNRRQGFGDDVPSRGSVTLVVVTGLASMVSIFWLGSPAWLLNHWFHFVAGVLSYWSVSRLIPQVIFFAYAALFAGSTTLALYRGTVTDFAWPSMAVGLLAALAIYSAGRSGNLTRWLDIRVLQYLGHISYSLYLIHFPLQLALLHGAKILTGTNPAAACFWFVFAGLACLGAAHVFHVAIERPSMRLAAHLKGVRSFRRRGSFQESESGFASETTKEK